MTLRREAGKAGKQIGVRVDADTHAALMGLAEGKGVTVSELFRAFAERVLVPAEAEEDERAAPIKARPPGSRVKALRALEVKRRLEDELAALGKDSEAAAAPVSPASLSRVRFVPPPDEEAEELETEELEVEGPAADDLLAEKGEDDGDRLLAVDGRLDAAVASLREVRPTPTFWDYLPSFWDWGPGGGLSVENLLIRSLERLRDGKAKDEAWLDTLDEDWLAALEAFSARVVSLRKKIVRLDAAGGAAAKSAVKALTEKLGVLRAEVLAAVEARRSAAEPPSAAKKFKWLAAAAAVPALVGGLLVIIKKREAAEASKAAVPEPERAKLASSPKGVTTAAAVGAVGSASAPPDIADALTEMAKNAGDNVKGLG